MDIFQAIILSIVEGVTEFLPISSTGHLVLTAHLLNIPQTNFVKSFEVIIQLGAILAVVFLYLPKFYKNFGVYKNVLAAFIPTAIVGFLLYDFIKSSLLGNTIVTVLALLIGGVALIFLEKIHHIVIPNSPALNEVNVFRDLNSEKQNKILNQVQHDISLSTHNSVTKIEDLTLKQSILIGLCQSISVIPGVSRSAATILGGMFLGANRQTAVEFSFLLAVPTMAAATGLDLMETSFTFTSSEWSMLAVGVLGSFMTAILVVKWFIKYVQTNNFVWFGVYRIIVGLLFIYFGF